MSFKLPVVQEYETTKVSLGALKRKYGIQGSAISRWIENMVTLISQTNVTIL